MARVRGCTDPSEPSLFFIVFRPLSVRCGSRSGTYETSETVNAMCPGNTSNLLARHFTGPNFRPYFPRISLVDLFALVFILNPLKIKIVKFANSVDMNEPPHELIMSHLI